jgi:hypothetical protein
MSIKAKINLGVPPLGAVVPWYKSSALKLNTALPSYISQFDKNRYYNSTVGVRAFPYTATRASNAMMWDSQGRLVWAPANMLLNSASLSTQSVTVSSGAPYTLSFYGTGEIVLSDGGSGTLTGTGANDRVSLSFTASTTSVTFTVTGTVTNAQLEMTGIDSPKPYNATTGTAYYGPRLDYNPATGAARGLLVEAVATNNCPQSFPSTSSGTNVTITQDTSFHGFPTNLATANGASAGHFMFTSSVTPTASATLRLSAVVKADTESRVQLTASSAWAATDVYANFNMTTGTVLAVGAGASNATITPLGNGWHLIGLTCTASGTPGAGTAVVLAFIDSDAATRIQANTLTTSFYYTFLGHYEHVYGDLSLIPTYGAAATRAADIVSESTDTWLDNTKGTMYAAVEAEAVNTGFPNVFWISTAGTDRTALYFNASSGGYVMEVRAASTTTAQQGVTAPYVGVGVVKGAGRYTTNDCVMSRAGTNTGGDATVTMPASLAEVRLGMSGGAANQLNGWIREVRYYPDASASNAQLNTLTT